MVAELITLLLQRLNSHPVRYVHWKSNCRLADALRGVDDLDLLVDRRDVAAFEGILAQLGFKRGVGNAWQEEPSIFHFFGLDVDSGELIHVHAYYRLITGGALFKNWHLPVEELLLSSSRIVDGVSVPDRAAEYVVFVLRKMLEHGSMTELLLLRRESEALRQELDWLAQGYDHRECARILEHWLCCIDPELFRSCAQALGKPGCLESIRLARRIRAGVAPFSRRGTLQAFVVRSSRFIRKLRGRIVRRESSRVIATGGSVVALVGPEATGKSTIAAELEQWLGRHFRVTRVHAGRPPPSLVTWLPVLLLPALRKALPSLRSGSIERDLDDTREPARKAVRGLRRLGFVVRSYLLAADRRRLLVYARRMAARGAIVLCDRYPTNEVGAMDSAQVRPALLPQRKLSFVRWLGNRENAIYDALPPPDIVVRLEVPVETAVARNASRTKRGKEDESYVRRRHAQAVDLQYSCPRQIRVSTDRSLSDTLEQIKRDLWAWL